MRLLIAEDEKDLADSLISLSRMDEEHPPGALRFQHQRRGL